MEKNAVWDEAKLEKLRNLWDEGLPITKIGLALGVSRNAIAGKAHRLGLPKRNSPISNSGEPRKKHINAGNFFSPKKAKLNTKVWKNHHRPEDINKIVTELAEWCDRRID